MGFIASPATDSLCDLVTSHIASPHLRFPMGQGDASFISPGDQDASCITICKELRDPQGKDAELIRSTASRRKCRLRAHHVTGPLGFVFGEGFAQNGQKMTTYFHPAPRPCKGDPSPGVLHATWENVPRTRICITAPCRPKNIHRGWEQSTQTCMPTPAPL